MQTDREGDAGSARVLSLHLTALGLCALLLVMGAPVCAQNDVPPASVQSNGTTQPATQLTLREMVEQRQNNMQEPSVKELLKALPPSLPVLLGLDARQVERLDVLYDDFALRRMEQEAKIARWQDELKRAQSPAAFNERKANGLLKSIRGAQDTITSAFLRARSEAFKVLIPSQRVQLQAMAAELASASQPSNLQTPPATAPANGVRPVRDDAYRQLLLMPLESLLQTPIDTQTGRRLLAERASGRYNRYSRYNNRGYGGYSPFGVYGTYGYGHSGFGIGIGGIFGGHGGFGHGGFGYGGFGHHPHHGGAHH